MNKPQPEIILASQSPRRQELLHRIVPEFRVAPSGVDEMRFQEKDPVRFALLAAEAKAKDIGEKYPSAVVIAADTVVNLEDEILGKPADRAEGRRMLEKLSGQKHRVITAVALFKKDENKTLCGYEISRVTFRRLTAAEIDGYLASGDFLDKAGSYAVQEIGDTFVEKLEGDYDNVVGFPVRRVKRMLDEFLSPEWVVPITDIALPHDWGVGKIDKAVAFTPGAVIGDTVRIKVMKTRRRHWFGKLIRLEEPSPFRTEPECPHFGVCGGCAFQNLQYENQLELKENYLTRTLLKIGRLSLDEVEREAIVPSPSVYFYRNKMEYAFVGPAGDIYLGLRERSSPLERYKKGTVALRVCPIFSRTVEPLFRVFRDFANSTDLAAYDPLTRHGFFRNLVLREAKGTGDMLAVLVTRSGKHLEAKDLGERIQAAVPQVKSLWSVENDRVSDVVDYTDKSHILGEKFIEENLHDLALRIYPESFFQPNPGCAADLYRRIIRETQSISARRALGLYCGSGSIELALGRAVVEAVGIDSEPTNIRVAEENSRLSNIQNCRFIEGRVEDILKPAVFQGFDLLILDPPRAGISPKGMKHILALSIPHIIYVSCNPGAFARDVRLLTDGGYHLRKLGCYDFFPHTPHLETLGILVK